MCFILIKFSGVFGYFEARRLKHGWVTRAAEWPHSSVHRFIREGLIDAAWEDGEDIGIVPGE